MKKRYTAPDAQVMLFAPAEAIASWKTGTSGKNWWTDPALKFWGLTPTVSATTTGELVYDPENGEFKIPKK